MNENSCIRVSTLNTAVTDLTPYVRAAAIFMVEIQKANGSPSTVYS